MEEKLLSITCPLCGRKNAFPLEILVEGSDLQCPSCKVKINLHGHMWQDIQSEIARLKQKT